MEESLFTYLKGIALLVALAMMLYPAVLLLQVLTGTVTESPAQIVGLSALSVAAWLWASRLYRSAEFVGVRMDRSE